MAADSGAALLSSATDGETAHLPSARGAAVLPPPTCSGGVAAGPLTPADFARLLPLVLEHIRTYYPVALSGLPLVALSDLPPAALSGLLSAALSSPALTWGEEDAAMHVKEEKVERLVQATLRRFGLAPPPPPLADDPRWPAGGNGATTLWGALLAALRAPPPPLDGVPAAAATAGAARPKPPSKRGLLFAFARVMTQLGAPPGPILAALRTAWPDIELAASVFGHLCEAVVYEDMER